MVDLTLHRLGFCPALARPPPLRLLEWSLAGVLCPERGLKCDGFDGLLLDLVLLDLEALMAYEIADATFGAAPRGP